MIRRLLHSTIRRFEKRYGYDATPTMKRALGHAHTCERLRVGGETVTYGGT